MLNFIQLAKDFNLQTAESGHHHCTRGWIQTHCPFCASGRSGFHLGYNLSQGNFACWRCGGMGYNKVLSRLLPNIPLREIYSKYLSGRRGGTRTIKARRLGQASRVIFPDNCQAGLLPAHVRYLRGRGFKNIKKLVELWDLRCTAGLSGEWSWRIIAPIYDVDEQIVSFTGRAIGERSPKYKTEEVERSVTNPKSILYGEHLCQSSTVVVVEGPTDVWNLGPGTVGTLGAAWSTDQAALLRKYERVVIVPDMNDKGVSLAKAHELANWLSSSDLEVEVVEGLDNDPGSMTEGEVHEFIATIVPEWV